jgi:TonB family protein
VIRIGFSLVSSFSLLLIYQLNSYGQFDFTDSVVSRKFISPAPVIGWDSLLHTITYPELCRRANIEGKGTVRVTIDTNGTIASIVFKDLVELFQDSIKSAFERTAWSPGLYDGRPKSIEIMVPVEFYLYDFTTPRRLHVGAKSHLVDKMK